MARNVTDMTVSRNIQTSEMLYAEENTTFTYYPAYTASELAFEYVIFILGNIILAIAVIGNSLTFCICMRKDNRKRSFMMYLSALSIFDTLNCFAQMLSKIAVSVEFSEGSAVVYCKLSVFFFNSFQYISSWLKVAISLERTVSTKLPYHVSRIGSQRFGFKTILFIVIIIFILNSHALYGWTGYIDDSYIVCAIMPGTYWILNAYFHPIVHALFYSLIPGFLIILCNTVMVKSVFASARIRGTISDQAAKKNRELMKVAVLISISFIVLTSPGCLFTIFGGTRLNLEPTATESNALYVTLVMGDVNNGITFFLYVISGARFRQHLKELFQCKVCRKN